MISPNPYGNPTGDTGSSSIYRWENRVRERKAILSRGVGYHFPPNPFHLPMALLPAPTPSSAMCSQAPPLAPFWFFAQDS